MLHSVIVLTTLSNACVLERHRLAADDLLVHFEFCLIDAALQFLVHSGIRISGGNPFDVLRVMEAQSCSPCAHLVATADLCDVFQQVPNLR